jgi:hypothetical protein
MIPSTNNKLLVSEDWKKIYQSFRNSDFQSYDFETLRRTMIGYLQQNYPEDFNDFIESSEYIALIDLIAYLGQNLSFRIDLNARENFLETAQRRDSILRLAQLISYTPTRNVPASGLLKITSISTTDTVIDGNGINLANTPVAWNDPTNSNWYQQFVTIMNSAMPGSFSFGKPYDRKTIDGILTEQYRINSANQDVPVYNFLKNINGTPMNFEIVPATFSGASAIYEESPRPGNTFSLIYKNDNQGSGSNNTGFFAKFKQGILSISSFNISTPVPNEIIGVNTPDINNTDVWLWRLGENGSYATLWTKVSDVVGNNVIYNSLNKDERNIYSVTSRDRDQIDLNFADGSFGNLPKGQFRLFYRQSNGLTYTIKPEQMTGIAIDVPYYNKSGQGHTLRMILALQYTVNNSSGPETNASIQSKAPQAYYTQNRMVTAEDYNIAPLTLSNDILKVKSVNRVSSGLSKYFDLKDVSGKYSTTNIFANDGVLYKDSRELNFEFEFSNRNEVFSVIKQKLEPIILSSAMRSFYLDKDNFSRVSLDLGISWTEVNKTSGQSRGYFKIPKSLTTNEQPLTVGAFTTNNLKYISAGALIKFVAPTSSQLNYPVITTETLNKNYFKPSGKLVRNIDHDTVNYVWTKVIQVVGDGSNTGQGPLDDGTGPIILSNPIPSNAVPIEIIPKFVDVFSYAFENELVNLCLNQRNFGLSFSEVSRSWFVIFDTNLDLINPFSLDNQGSTDNTGRDASWLVAFTWTGKKYKVRYRISDYVFESVKDTAFFIDPTTINYDFTNNTVVKDQITVLPINSAVVPAAAASTSTFGSLGKEYVWQIDGNIIEADGYIEPKKVTVSFYDYTNSGQIEDPDSFTRIVEPDSVSTETTTVDNSNVGSRYQFVYFKKLSDGLRYEIADRDMFLAYPNENQVPGENRIDGQLYYFYDKDVDVVKSYSADLAETGYPWIYRPEYYARPGRSGLKFHYIHNSGEDRRIDPSKSNIIDIYLLTSSYDSSYRSWLISESGAEPLAPTSQSLEQNFAFSLESIKTVSDEIVFQPVKYKVLFGNKADINLQATFKAVRNSSRPISDNEIKTRILNAMQDFFALENWDFGQPFNFSELSAYVMNLLTPDITNFVIVPKSNNNFGSLYEIACQSNEIFINGATVADIEIIDAITASQLKSSSIITSSGN